ncbi:class II aldolase/adducin family protein [Methylomonas rhizoryzae]|uniref:class II aldolase/adducin family protein n=1 Tax=Methylomonas rhizoryzae TaxID=2608981 RepID=UPI001232D37A|nr:class II aldolase/adducin family protein [Methylomonas rhizoryzae]
MNLVQPVDEPEGVIKYQLTHRHANIPYDFDVAGLNGWRSLLFKLGLIGQSPDKYQGLGYGNISLRLQAERQAFIVTGTQTGHLPYLYPKHFAIVEAAEPRKNSILARGPCKPSSEALTHASIYLNSAAQAVIHGHCPEIWRHCRALGLAATDENIPYGSVQMADAVAALIDRMRDQNTTVFCMLGHLDGVVSYGDSLAEAATALLIQLARALAIEIPASSE